MRKSNGKASGVFVAAQKRPYTWEFIERKDKFPGPYAGNPRIIARESPEQRAFRRFPIDRHKPGGWDDMVVGQPMVANRQMELANLRAANGTSTPESRASAAKSALNRSWD